MNNPIHRDFDFAGKVIGLAMKVHRALGPGFLESVYANALEIELRVAGISFEREKKLQVFYRGEIVGDFACDFFLDGLVLEIKAVTALVAAHEVQLVNYLSATGIEHGLLLNFGGQSLEFKKKFRTYRTTEPDRINKNNRISEEPESFEASISTCHPPHSDTPCFPALPNSVNPVNSVKTSAPHSVQKAFTLLELLVAIAVLAILVVMMMGLVSSASSLWRQSENRADAYREARAALMIMAGDLGSALSGATNTNHFVFGDAAGALLASGSPVHDSNRQAVFFLTSLPATAQDPAENKSDVCQAGYFVAFDRTAMSSNLPGGLPSLNLYRYFVSSDETFRRLAANPVGNIFTNNLIPPAASVELLARNIREFRVTPLMVTTSTPARYTNFLPSTNRPLPDAVEITLTAVNQEAARRFTAKNDWINGAPGLTNQQQTFTTRIRLNRPD